MKQAKNWQKYKQLITDITKNIELLLFNGYLFTKFLRILDLKNRRQKLRKMKNYRSFEAVFNLHLLRKQREQNVHRPMKESKYAVKMW